MYLPIFAYLYLYLSMMSVVHQTFFVLLPLCTNFKPSYKEADRQFPPLTAAVIDQNAFEWLLCRQRNWPLPHIRSSREITGETPFGTGVDFHYPHMHYIQELLRLAPFHTRRGNAGIDVVRESPDVQVHGRRSLLGTCRAKSCCFISNILVTCLIFDKFARQVKSPVKALNKC